MRERGREREGIKAGDTGEREYERQRDREQR